MRLRIGALAWGFTTACVGGEPAFDCEEVAIVGVDGIPDPCDVEACQACVDECGIDCAILESYPPQYACPDDSWDVVDTCPDWGPPTTTPGPRSENVVDLGCGDDDVQTLTADSTAPGTIAVTHIDYMLGCCPEEVEVIVSVEGQVLSVDYWLVNDLCECACMLDVSYDIVSVPAGQWTVAPWFYGATATVTVQ